jgi:DNA-binding NarL/FixJ family response regulator
LAKASSKPSTPSRPSISIILIDDNRLVREGLAGLIRGETDFKILAASADADEALRKVRDAKPQIVLLDFGLEGSDSMEVASGIRTQAPDARIIIMGLSPLQDNVAEFVRTGVSGFLMKDSSFETFVNTIRAVAGGAQVLPKELTGSLFGQIARNAVRKSAPKALAAVRITRREREVIDLISDGLSNKEIAVRLGIAVHTVKSHVHNVLEKLSLHSRLEVAAFTRPQ